VDHDSLKAVNKAIWWYKENNGGKDAVGTTRDSIKAAVIATLKSSGRRDSIRNGADDDGSGSMGVLEIAEKFAKTKQKPKRSMLFLWYTGEEKGLLGSRWYTDHPTVIRDSVVSAVNIDMIGRANVDDIKARGPNGYIQLVGSRRLSTEMGDLVEALNNKRKAPFTFDYQFDANGHPENIYCRSDHYNWARYSVPVTFFTTGLHGDYHQVTDEPQYIDYPHYASVTGFIYDMALSLANRDKNVVIDKPRPDPNGQCRQ
jgi:Zn-dependent M28 family amino/carboxypeptidase